MNNNILHPFRKSLYNLIVHIYVFLLTWPFVTSYRCFAQSENETGLNRKYNQEASIEQSKIDSVLNIIVIKGSILDVDMNRRDWHPQFPDMFTNYTIEKADSLVDLCESITLNTYGTREEVSVNGDHIRNPEPLPEPYRFLSIIYNLYEYTYGYGWSKKFNPYIAIDWYRKYRKNITPLAYAYSEICTSPFYYLIADTGIDLGLRYNDIHNRNMAVFYKYIQLKGELLSCIIAGVSDSELSQRMNRLLYEVPFFDETADLFDDDYKYDY